MSPNPLEAIDAKVSKFRSSTKDAKGDGSKAEGAGCKGDAPKGASPKAAIPAAWVALVNSKQDKDTRSQPWRAHDGIGEDKNFEQEPDLVRMKDAEYPGGSLAA